MVVATQFFKVFHKTNKTKFFEVHITLNETEVSQKNINLSLIIYNTFIMASRVNELFLSA